MKPRTVRILPHLLSYGVTTILAEPLGLYSPGNGQTNFALAAALTGSEGCSALQKGSIQNGFYEMNDLFTAAYPVDWNSDSITDYFGPAQRLQPFKDMVQQNLLHAHVYSYAHGAEAPNPDIHVRCDDPYKVCGSCSVGQGEYLAYNIGNEPHINFCPGYFRLGELSAIVNEVTGNKTLKEDMDAYYNRATAWARQVMHISVVGTAVLESKNLNGSSSTSHIPMGNSFLAGVKSSVPQLNNLRYAYGALRAKWIAALSPQKPYDAPNNPENYAMYAQARYLEKTRNIYPRNPVLDLTSQSALLADEKLQDSANPKYGCFDRPNVVTADGRTNGTTVMKSAGSRFNLTSPHKSGKAFFALFWALALISMAC